jgi:DNA repair protein RadC
MKLPYWIQRVLRRAPVKSFTPWNFIPQYRVKLVREGGLPFVRFRIDSVDRARALASRCIETYGQSDRKQFLVVMLNNQNDVIGVNVAATGSVSLVQVHPREILKPAILANASSIILCLSRAGGDVSPSEEDLANIETIVRAAWIIGIQVHEHLIISMCDERYFSFAEQGIIQKIYQSISQPKSPATDENNPIPCKQATIH